MIGIDYSFIYVVNFNHTGAISHTPAKSEVFASFGYGLSSVLHSVSQNPQPLWNIHCSVSLLNKIKEAKKMNPPSRIRIILFNNQSAW